MRPEKKSRKEVVSDYLKLLSVSPDLQGYTYLREAILMILEDETLKFGITKQLYPRIATKFKTKWTIVERNIRHAVDKAFTVGNIETLNDIFKNISESKGKLTNAQFIATLADYISLKEESLS